MEIELYIQKKKEFYSFFMEFIDSIENTDIQSFINNIDNQEFLKNKEESRSALQLLSKLADNHYRLPNFMENLGKMIQYLIQKKYQIFLTLKYIKYSKIIKVFFYYFQNKESFDQMK